MFPARALSFARFCAAAAAIISGTAFLGWPLGLPWLAGGGVAGVPIWPITAIGFFALACGFLANLSSQPRLAGGFVYASASIALLALGDHLLGGRLHLAHWLFGDEVTALAGGNPGLPGIQVTVTWLLLLLALYLGLRPGLRWANAATLVASIPLAIGTTALALLLMGMNRQSPEAAHVLSSVPAAVSALLLAASLIGLHAGSVLLRLRPSYGLMGVLLFPILLLIPAASALAQLWAHQAGVATELLSQALAAGANVLLLGLVLGWALTRLSRQEGTLREFAFALDSAPIAMIGTDGSIMHWSQGCERLYGWSAEEAEGQRKDMLLRTESDGWLEAIQSLGDGEEIDRELIETTRGGRTLRLLEHVRCIGDRDGSRVVVLSMTDITARAIMEEALRVSEERLAEAVDAHGLGVFEWDVRSGALNWSPGAEQRMGLEPGTITDFESWRAHVEPDDVQAIIRTVEQASAAKAERFSFRYRFIQPNGAVRSVEGSSRCFYDIDGELDHTVGVIVDVTERDEREAALQMERAQLRSVLDTVPDAMIVIDGEGIIRTFSAGAERTLGYSAAAVIGTSYSFLTPEVGTPILGDAFMRQLASGRIQAAGAVMKTHVVHADGRELPVEVRIGEAVVANERLFTIFLRDIADRLDVEERIGELGRELAHATRVTAMGEMAAGIAHELNQPLTAVVNYLSTAERVIQPAENGKALEFLKSAREQSMRAGVIIRKMREFVSKGEVEMRAAPIEQTIRDAVSMVLVGRLQYDVRVNVVLDKDAKTMLADRVQVQQVIVNLLRNAIEALQHQPPEERHILVKSRAVDEETVEISVSDTGSGLPAGLLDGLYQPFTTTKGDKGMGVGLSICRRIVEAHGGKMHGENRPEGGAIFRFTLPMFDREKVLEQ